MTVAEQIYEVVQNLSKEQAFEVLDFAQFLKTKKDSRRKVSSTDRIQAWKNLIDSVKAYEEDDFPTLEEIRSNQGEDVPRESW